MNSNSIFRSVLPHEPPPKGEGYLQIQAIWMPARIVDDTTQHHPPHDEHPISKELVEELLFQKFIKVSRYPPRHLSLVEKNPPYTKLRVSFDTWKHAHDNMSIYQTLTTHHLYMAKKEEEESGLENIFTALWNILREHANQRAWQISPLTKSNLPEPSWTRSIPPKFRRLIPRTTEDCQDIERERQNTRFVLLTNLLDTTSSQSDDNQNKQLWGDEIFLAQAIRRVLGQYDTSGDGIEVFIPKKQPNPRYIHVGMRSPLDAQAVVKHLQGKRVIWRSDNDPINIITSGPLFLDYAGITNRSQAQTAHVDPTRPQCTSTTDHVHVPGLVVIEEYITPAEEAALMAILTGPQAPWAPPQNTASFEHATVRRSVQHYGYIFDYQTANVLRDNFDCPCLPAIPDDHDHDMDTARLEEFLEHCLRDGKGWEILAAITERTRRYEFQIVNNQNKESVENKMIRRFPGINQLTVNQYRPGDGIGSHVDTPSAFADGLLSLSLNSGITMEFLKVDDENVKKLVYLPPRSLVLMSGDARYKWEHMIVSRRTDMHNGTWIPRQLRLSLTYRTVVENDGITPLPRREAHMTELSPPIWGKDHENSGKIQFYASTPLCERDHVHAVYDAIAKQWHHTRGKRGVLWPGATKFLQSIPPGSIVADIGCGDGKYFPAIWEAGSYVIGTDISEPLLRMTLDDGQRSEGEITENRRVGENRKHLRARPAVVVADCMHVPLRTNSCDAAICIAVMHHLSTPQRRKRCIEELARIVKPGGLVNVQAWAMDQEEDSRRRFAANDVFVPFNAQPKYLQIGDQTRDDSMLSEGTSTAQMYANALNAEYDDKKGLVVFKRYCHLYRLGELDQIASQVPGTQVIESGFESGNYYIIFEVQQEE
jgi:alkylated DNA repair protein alkB family protein 8